MWEMLGCVSLINCKIFLSSFKILPFIGTVTRSRSSPRKQTNERSVPK